MAPKEVDRQLLLTYLDGNCSRDQLLQIREYLHDEAYKDSLNLFMEEEWADLNRQPFPPLPGMDDQYKKFSAAYIKPRPKRPVRVMLRITGMAAALLLGFVGLWLLLNRSGARPGGHDAAAAGLSWHNDPGQHREILLPDSSRVFLGPAGSLRYREDGERGRLVNLEGEAYFIVKHDTRLPFTVVSGALSTRDIGTEFNVRYYPGEPSIAIAVASGKVQVLHTAAAASSDAASTAAASSAAAPAPAPLASLGAGQLLRYDSVTRRSGITDVPDPSAIGSWRKGILSFRRQRLEDVTDELQRYYGLSFRYSDPAAKEILITTLLDNKSPGDALEILSLTAGVHFTHAGHVILIK